MTTGEVSAAPAEKCHAGSSRMFWPGSTVFWIIGSFASKPVWAAPPPSCGQLFVTSMPAAALPLVAVATSAVGPKPVVTGTVTLVAGMDPLTLEVVLPTTLPSRVKFTVSAGPNPVPLTDTLAPGAAKPRETLSLGPPATDVTTNSSSAAGTAAGPSTATA